jgi:hypothetical protein
MPDETASHVPVDLPVHARGIPEGEVVRPALQVPIQLSNQVRDRLEALMTVGHLAHFIPFPLDRFLRRKHIQIPLMASFQIAIIPKRVSQKVQTRPFIPQVHHARLFRLISNWNFPSSLDSIYPMTSDPICFANTTKSSA